MSLRNAELSDKLVEVRLENDTLVSQVQFRQGSGSNISPFGGYSCALARNRGHAGALTAAEMVAGDELHGNVKDKHTIIVYEHRCSVAKQLRSKNWFLDSMAHMLFMAVCYKGDATHDNMMERGKKHVACIAATCLSSSADIGGIIFCFVG